MSERDDRIRLAGVEHCKRLANVWGEAIPYAEIKAGFIFENLRIMLVGPQGIFKPKEMDEGPLTMTSTLDSPYEDQAIPDENVISYDYALPSREHENMAAQKLVGTFMPVIYFRQVCDNPSEYVVITPMYIAGADPVRRKFTLADVPSAGFVQRPEDELRDMSAALRLLQQSYRERTVRERLHQADFRRDVLSAYRTRCAVCELRLRPLLDGAHIIADKKPGGDPVVQNGLSLCSLHHRAFDRDILLVDPDYTVRPGKVTIADDDQAAIKNIRGFDGKRLWLPKLRELWPDPDRLKKRLEVAS